MFRKSIDLNRSLSEFIAHLKRQTTSTSSEIPKTLTSLEDNKAPLKRTKLRTVHDIPGPKVLPLIGSSLQYAPFGKLNSDYKLRNSLIQYERYGPLWKEGIPFSREHLLHVYDPKDIETVLRAEGRWAFRPEIPPLKIYRKSRSHEPGLANLQGEEWWRARQPVNQFMLERRAAWPHFTLQNQIAEDFVSLLSSFKEDKLNPIQFHDLLKRFILEELCAAAFGHRVGCLDSNLKPDSWQLRFLRALHVVFYGIADMTYGSNQLWRLFPTKQWRDFDSAMDTLHSVTKGFMTNIEQNRRNKAITDGKRRAVVEQTRNFVNSASYSYDNQAAEEPTGSSVNSTSRSFADWLLSLDNINESEKALFITDLLGAGIDTINAALLFNFFNLAKNPHVQENLLHEIESKMLQEEELTAKVFDHMPLLRAVIKETHRLTPTSGFLFRLLDVELELQGFQIPAKTPILLEPGAASRIKDYFDKPHEFLPERWSRNGAGNKNVNASFVVLPFGFGARGCLGKRFAEQIILITISQIVKTFKLSLKDPKQDIELVNKLFNRPSVMPEFILHKR